jgi:uncharacterized protein YPO0396
MTAGSVHPGQWRLEHIELVNWGTFHGHHSLDVARQGFLLTGHSGSGKSSLVDAVTAVLTPRGKTRFNAAAADGSSRAGDRSVLSYVRGAWRRAADDDTGEVATTYLRPGATWSGILLRYSDGTLREDGQNNVVTLVKLFHVRRGDMSPADVRDVHLMLPSTITLLELEAFTRNGLDVRGLKRSLPQAHVDAEHSRFAARFSRAPGITGDRAIVLLHKTQSAKNLGSLDDLFRTFMLDEPSTFATADRAVEQFTELSQAHDAVVQASEQIEALMPLVEASKAYDEAGESAAEGRVLSSSLDDFTQSWKLELARSARSVAADGVHRSVEAHRQALASTDQAELRVREAQAVVDSRGGARLDALDAQVREAATRLDFTRSRRTALELGLRHVGVDMPSTFAELIELQRVASTELADAETARATAESCVRTLHGERARVAQRRDAVTAELESLRQSRSNIGKALLDARRVVARATGLPESTLPYAAELLQVRPEFADWTGAIERVLRPLAAVMLVPAAHELVVSAAVDAAHLGAHLRFETVPAVVEPPRRPSSSDSLVYRVEVADGHMRPWLHHELARRFDYLCVESSQQLVETDRGVTRAGQVKRGRRSFEKDDRFRVDDRSHWVLGFDNADKVDHFLELLRNVGNELDRIDGELGAQERSRRAHDDRLRVLRDLESVEWSAIDVDSLAGQHEATVRARAELLSADGNLRTSQHLLQAAMEGLQQAKQSEQTVSEAAAAARAALAMVDEVVSDLEQLTLQEVPPSVAARLESEFHAQRTSRQVTHQTIDVDARKVGQALNRRLQDALSARTSAQLAICDLTGAFVRRWPALAGDLTPDIDDRCGFLQILATLRADRLPDFEKRFFDLLRDQSQQNVGLLAQEIRRAPGQIRHRVDPINTSLRRSAFSPGRFLQIKVEDCRPAVAQDFLRDLNTIATGALAADEDRGDAEARFAVLQQVMRRLGSSEHADIAWRSLCLDTRRHVRFIGLEVDSTHTVLDIYDSGDGRSGGQKQKLVVFCLAAALRYQLTRETDEVPAYGSVIMDEAFDKADATFTRMALDIFREFGFHMILATPLKLLQTLEDYVGGIALVTCHDSNRSHVAPVPFDDVAEAVEADIEPPADDTATNESRALELDLW